MNERQAYAHIDHWRERAMAAEAELRECRDSFAEVERVATRVVTAEAALSAANERAKRLVDALRGIERWFVTRPWEGSPDGSSFGCGPYTPAERRLGYGTYRDERVLPDVLRAALDRHNQETT